MAHLRHPLSLPALGERIVHNSFTVAATTQLNTRPGHLRGLCLICRTRGIRGLRSLWLGTDDGLDLYCSAPPMINTNHRNFTNMR